MTHTFPLQVLPPMLAGPSGERGVTFYVGAEPVEVEWARDSLLG